MARGSDTTATVIRISPTAHIASGFIALFLMLFMPALGRPGLFLLVIPIVLSVAIERLRTMADADTVTARGMRSSRTMRWQQIDGLEFTRGRWARACLTDGSAVQLPAVTFATLPLLTAASKGKVPNPYRR
ncbi:MAG: PH domain-containing protein [Mycobacterium sp.]|nr:PH domain-containing protein [Mycobacterium sp.]